MEFRPYYLSREWVRMGHDVSIVAASFSHLRQKNIDMQEPIKEEYIDGIRYVWLKTPAYNGNGIGRIKNMLSFLHKLYKYEKEINKNNSPDVVIASSTYPLDSYPANWMAKKYKAKFVFELHDLWPMSPMVLGNMSKWHPFIMVMQKAEDYWCRNADLVVSLLPDAYKHLVTRGMQIEKYVVIPNGISPDEWGEEKEEIPEEHGLFIDKLKNEDKFIVAYLGGLVESNNLLALVDVAEIIRENARIHILLIGKGPEKDKLERNIEERELSNISLLPFVSKKAVPALLGKMDLLIRIASASKLEEFGASPNKIFDYMMSSKPVLWNYSSEKNLVSDAQCGFTLIDFTIDKLAEKLLKISKMEKKELLMLGENGHDYVLKNYTYSKLAEKFISSLR
jgi:glycosyltransferase involved in cell wall biosynthesis